MIAAYATSPPPSIEGGAENIRNRITALVSVPIISQGRNFPQRVFVLATTTPMMGSLNASNIRATKRITPIATADTPMIS